MAEHRSILRDHFTPPDVDARRPASYSACELDCSSDSSDVSSRVRRSSYVTAAESGDLLFMLKTLGSPCENSEFTSAYTTQESGDFLQSVNSGGSGLGGNFRSPLESPKMGRWMSTGSLSLSVGSINADKRNAATQDSDNLEGREQWTSSTEFILSCLGYAVGLGNVWRFPYLTYINGGGAFLIPYTLMLMLIGIPMFMIELAVGQFSASGPVHVFSAAPLFQGIGVGMVTSVWGAIYYQMIITWSLYYLFASWQSVLPWSNCGNAFNTPNCYTKSEAASCEVASGLWYNQTCYNSTYIDSFNVNQTVCRHIGGTGSIGSLETQCQNVTTNAFLEHFKANLSHRSSASEEYFNFGMLARSDSIEDTGVIKWDLCLTYLLAWIITCLSIIKGIKSSGKFAPLAFGSVKNLYHNAGASNYLRYCNTCNTCIPEKEYKVVYFTATFPYVLLLILFFRAVTLPGALKGIIFYVKPDFNILLTPKVWSDAAGQIFFSLSVGGGGLMTYASYNRFHNNIYRDTLIVSIGNCLTSFFAGFVIFSILGFMATELGVEVKEVVKSGSGLAFVAYPEIVSRLVVPQLWASMFFFMLLTLGLDSMFAGLENTQTAILDTFPRLRKFRPLVAVGICLVCFLLGLTQCTNAGIYWVELSAYYNAGWAVLIMGAAECMVFAWVYGARRLAVDIETMVGFKLRAHWWITWTFITPVILSVIFILNVYKFTPLTYGDYVLPPWAQTIGWLMAINGVIMIPVVMVYHVVRSYNNPDYEGMRLQQRLVKLCKPAPRWTANMLASIREDNVNANNSSDPSGKGSSVRYRSWKISPADYPKATQQLEAST